MSRASDIPGVIARILTVVATSYCVARIASGLIGQLGGP